MAHFFAPFLFALKYLQTLIESAFLENADRKYSAAKLSLIVECGEAC
jgi:hypothetical protein